MWKQLVVAAAGLIIGLIAVDYVGAFGMREMQMQDLLHLRFKMVDKTTGVLVSDVHVTCVRRGSVAACSQKPDMPEGLVELNFVVAKSVKFTRLFKFKKAEKLWLHEQGEVFLVFIHPNYGRLFLQVKAQDLEQWRDQVKTVELEAEQPQENAR